MAETPEDPRSIKLHKAVIDAIVQIYGPEVDEVGAAEIMCALNSTIAPILEPMGYAGLVMMIESVNLAWRDHHQRRSIEGLTKQ